MCKAIDCFAPTCTLWQHDELRPISGQGMVTLAENRRTVGRRNTSSLQRYRLTQHKQESNKE